MQLQHEWELSIIMHLALEESEYTGMEDKVIKPLVLYKMLSKGSPEEYHGRPEEQTALILQLKLLQSFINHFGMFVRSAPCCSPNYENFDYTN